MDDLSAQYYSKSALLPTCAMPLIDEAEEVLSQVADLNKKLVLQAKIDQIRRGDFDLVLVTCPQGPVCFAAVRPMSGVAQLTYGHICRSSGRAIEPVFKVIIKTIVDQGFQSISSIFNWPKPGDFIQAAEALGFSRVDRTDMCRDCKAPNTPGQAAASIRIVEWSPSHFEGVAGLLFGNVYPEDRIVNPLTLTLDGCRVHLGNIVDHRYGELLRELSFTALWENEPVGILLSTAWSNDVLIAELAVDRDFRGRGLAGAMIDRLIEGSAASEKGQIRLTVTTSNHSALSLYRRKGFAPGAEVCYYVYVPRNIL